MQFNIDDQKTAGSDISTSTPENGGRTRREFLARMTGAAAAVAFGGAVTEAAAQDRVESHGRGHVVSLGDSPAAVGDRVRGLRAYQLRAEAARPHLTMEMPEHADNGDEALYPNRIGSYSKGLPHNDLGEVDPDAYRALLRAVTLGTPAAFATIPQGGTTPLVSPQAALAFQLEGTDSHFFSAAPPPAFASAREAAEMAEVYWKALLRDVPFAEYSSHPLAYEAAADLSAFSDFDAPKSGGVVIPDMLFRGGAPGTLTGPYISQFLTLQPTHGFTPIAQKFRTCLPGSDFLTDPGEFLHVLRGGEPAGSLPIDSEYRYIRSGRDLAHFVHYDFPYQAALNAALVLLGFGEDALDPNHPYRDVVNQRPYITFGGPDIVSTTAYVAKLALQAAWFQKWQVHRRLRPEQFAGRVHHHLSGAVAYPIHDEMFASEALDRLLSAHGGYLLPMAYAEGCPQHPSYTAGHATAIGATTTILKAFFNVDFVIPQPMVATPDGHELMPYTEETLTVGGELNKLAANIGLGRDFAGVHWRSDLNESLRIGEAVAIRLLQEMKTTYNEDFGGFHLTKFDGSEIVIS